MRVIAIAFISVALTACVFSFALTAKRMTSGGLMPVPYVTIADR